MRIVNEDEMLKDAAFQRMKDELDRNTRTHYELKQARAEGIELGKAEGIELGKAEGIELGKAQTEMKYVFEMIKKGLDVQFISEVTGVSIELLKQIENEEKHQK